MTPELLSALILIALLLVKHLFADFFLQTGRMLINRGQYLHFGRVQHAAVHAGLSAICFILVGAPIKFVILICLAEGVLHFHIDWLKGRHADHTGYTPTDAGYWRALGIDQLAHQLTYVAMVAAPVYLAG